MVGVFPLINTQITILRNQPIMNRVIDLIYICRYIDTYNMICTYEKELLDRIVSLKCMVQVYTDKNQNSQWFMAVWVNVYKDIEKSK